MQVHLRRLVLGDTQPALVVLDRPVRVYARLHADLGGAEIDGLADPAAELVLVVLVGIRRAPSLSEAAEGAAHDAHVGDIDVAIHHERHRVSRKLAAQRVRRLAHVLDRLGPVLGEQRRELVLAERAAAVRPLDGSRHELAPDRALLAAAGGAARDERPVLHLDRVEHALIEPVGVHVLRVHAQALGEGRAARGEPLAHLVHRRERMLRGDVVAIGGEAAEVRRALVDQGQPPVGEVRRDLNAHVRHQPSALAHQRAHVIERDLGGPRGERLGRSGCVGASAPPPRSPPAPRRSSAGAARSSGGSPPGGGRTRRARRRAPRAPRSRSCLGLADADQDPARERDAQLTGGADRLEPQRRVLGRRALVGHEIGRIDSSIRPWDAVTSRRRARSARAAARRGSCAAGCPRSSARSQHQAT